MSLPIPVKSNSHATPSTSSITDSSHSSIAEKKTSTMENPTTFPYINIEKLESGAVVNINCGTLYNYGSPSATTKAKSEKKRLEALHDVICMPASICKNKYMKIPVKPSDIKTVHHAAIEVGLGKCVRRVRQKVKDKWDDFKKFWKGRRHTTGR